jgi:hypothetical protein
MAGCGKEALPFQVGSFPAGNTPLDGVDFAGNAWEWVNDWYDANYYQVAASMNPPGPYAGIYKVIRGGGWNSTAGELRTANRAASDPTRGFNDVGFRCVLGGDEITGVSGGDPLHRVSEQGGSVEPGLRGYRDPGNTPASWSWGNPMPLCTITGEGLIYLSASNTLGAPYAGTHNGSPLTCGYDSSRAMLVCIFPLDPASSGAEHDLRFYIVRGDGTALPGSEYDVRLPASAYAGCQGNQQIPNQGVVSARTVCAPEGTAAVELTSSIPASFSAISILSGSVNLNYSDPGSECLAGLSSANCPLPGITGPASLTGTANMVALDGITPFSASFSAEVPACNQQGSSPALVVQSTCDQSGRSSFALSSDPADSLLIALNTPASCAVTGGPALRWDCLTPPSASDGLVHLDVTCALASDPAVSVPVAAPVFLPAVCPATPAGTASLQFGQPVCRPDGLPGGTAFVQFVGPAGAAAVQVNSGGVSTDCSESSTSPRTFACNIPISLPTDLQFCASVDSVNVVCQASPYSSASLPARCGGEQGGAIWTIVPGCLPQGASMIDLAVSISGGPNVAALSASTSAGVVACGADTASSGTFHCILPAATPGPSVNLTAVLVDGSTLTQSYDGLVTFPPEQCGTSNTPSLPGSGTCVDDAAISAWQHVGLPQDVNNDGCVSPIDVLLLINRMNAFGVGVLPVPRPAGAGFFDVSGDGALTPLDVLMVINYLNAHAGETCTPGCTPRALPGNTITAACTGRTPVVTVQVDAGVSVDAITFNGFAPAPADCSGMGTNLVVCALARELSGSPVDALVSGRYSDGAGYLLRYALTPPVCQVTAAPTAKPHQATCADYSPNECEQNGCYLVNGVCQSTPGSQTCPSYTDKSTCLANGCNWDGQQCTQ